VIVPVLKLIVDPSDATISVRPPRLIVLLRELRLTRQLRQGEFYLRLNKNLHVEGRQSPSHEEVSQVFREPDLQALVLVVH